jgi:hypothetical protein
MIKHFKKLIVIPILALIGFSYNFGAVKNIETVPSTTLAGTFTSKEFLVTGNEGHISIIADIDPNDMTATGKEISIKIQVKRNNVWRDWGGCSWIASPTINTGLEATPRPNCGFNASEFKNETVRVIFDSAGIKTGIKILSQ